VPGCEKAFVIDAAPTIGVRETRRFRGEYFLTDEDVYRDISFDDNIMFVERKMPCPDLIMKIDVHPVDPIEGSKDDPLTRDNPNSGIEMRRFHFNYRMLLPVGVDNMLFAGRTMSTTHATEAFTRSMPWCMRLGQVAGTAAALSVKENVSPKKLEYRILKDTLIKQGYTRL
ncbi:MAG: FAD-dependent oxidoreductase, partial [Treponema sp.]|nr:FAD-dependent oxidoreductase [Treponema sp.]